MSALGFAAAKTTRGYDRPTTKGFEMRSLMIALCSFAMLVSTVYAQPGRRMSNPRQEMTDLFEPIFALDLTPAQQREMREIISQLRRSMQDAMRADENAAPTPAQNRREQFEKPRREAYDKALAILTPSQRAKLLATSNVADNPLGMDSGKSLSPDLFRRVRQTATRAGETTALSPNVIDSVAKPAGEVCNDETFIRRVYVDVIGATPTVDEVLDFLNDSRADKRARLIDKLMAHPSFADYQAMHWCDVLRVKAEFPINLWPNGAAVYHRWLRDAVLKNKPYDEFARELLTASGSNFRNPPANFYRAAQAKDSYTLAEAAALTFMGSRTESWTAEQQQEIRKFFAHVAFKETAEWKEEIVYWDRQPPKQTTATLPDGKVVSLSADRDPRKVFADWLITAENPWFARAAANRVWFWLTGVGIVHEPDDFHPDNPPSNPQLLDLLAQEFIASGYDLQQLYRLILTSRTYQQQSPGYHIRPLDAETLQDTFCRIFGTEVSYSSDVPEPFTYVPSWQSTVSLADGSMTSPFLMTFGRPSRDSGREADRPQESTESQRMFLINSTEINGWIEKSWLLRVLPMDSRNRDLSLQYLWLEVLSRYPTEAELRKADELFGRQTDSTQARTQDLIWMLINTKEFSSRH